MAFYANFDKLSQQFGKDGISEACRTLEELLIESKLLANRLAVLPDHVQILHEVIESLCSDATLWGEEEDSNVKCLVLALKLTRNLCAEVQANQAMICCDRLDLHLEVSDNVRQILNCREGLGTAFRLVCQEGRILLPLLHSSCLKLPTKNFKEDRNKCQTTPPQGRKCWICHHYDSPIVGMVLSMMEGTVSRKALPRLEDAVIAGLQLLGNICVEYSSGQAKVWTLMFPSMLCKLLYEESAAVSDMCNMIAHNCTVQHADNMKSLCSNGELSELLWSKILASKADLEWGLLLLEQAIMSGFIGAIYTALESSNKSQLHLNLLEVVLDKIGNDNTCALPEELPKGDQLCSIDSNDVIFFAKQFEKCALANSDMREIDRNYKILMLLLQLLNSLSVKPQYLKLLQQFPQLLENTAGLLQAICSQDGTANSAQNKTNLRDVTIAGDDHDFPLLGLKKNLVRLLGNLCYNDRSNQDKIRDCGAIVLLLNQCSIDHSNPYIQQWSIWAIRNICDKNEENQKMIKSLENRSINLDTPVPGLQVEVGDDGKLRTKC